jgi:hypothetical protein
MASLFILGSAFVPLTWLLRSSLCLGDTLKHALHGYIQWISLFCIDLGPSSTPARRSSHLYARTWPARCQQCGSSLTMWSARMIVCGSRRDTLRLRNERCPIENLDMHCFLQSFRSRNAAENIRVLEYTVRKQLDVSYHRLHTDQDGRDDTSSDMYPGGSWFESLPRKLILCVKVFIASSPHPYQHLEVYHDLFQPNVC